MEVKIEGSKQGCSLSWNFSKPFDKQSLMKNISIITSVQCSLLGDEAFVVKFKSLSIFSDSQGNKVSGNVLQARALRFDFVSDSMAAAIAGAGMTFSAINLVSFCIVIVVNMLQYFHNIVNYFRSAATGAFWEFVSLSQMLSFLPVLNCNTPNNLVTFLTQYVTVTSVSFPFNMLPSFIPNPMNFLDSFITGPLNEKFDQQGVISLSFVWNFGGQIYSWGIMLLIYFFLCIIVMIIPKTRCKQIKEWKEDYEYNAVIRVLIECYLQLNYTALLDLWNVLFKYFYI